MKSDPLHRLHDAFATALLPPPALLLSEWARKNFVLSSDYSASTGSFEPYPYQIEPLDVLSPSNPAEMMVLLAAAQTMKTLLAMILLGYVIDVEPGPVLIVQPNEADAKAFSGERVAPMLRDIPCLQGKVFEAKSRDSSNTILHKALALDTPIPTPSGWTTMGDIQTGDTVFDEQGKPCSVVDVTPIIEGRPCYRVRFSDGCSVVADETHPWQVQTWKVMKRGGQKPKQTLCEEVVSTLGLLKAQSGARTRSKYAIPMALPLETPKADLPVDPYILGAWLGDGLSHRAAIVAGLQDEEMGDLIASTGIAATRKVLGGNLLLFHLDPPLGSEAICQHGHNREIAGVTSDGHCKECRKQRGGTTPATRCSNSIRAELRNLGLLKKAGEGPSLKRIPPQYLRASRSQRLSLLQGLMDTDGSISDCSDYRGCVFITTLPQLADGFSELLNTLSIKHSVKEFSPRCTYKGKVVMGRPAYRIPFQVGPDVPVFRLSRKLDRQLKNGSVGLRTTRRRVVSVTPVESVPVRCISVDSPSHLYLAGRGMVPTHNSFHGGSVALTGTVSPRGLRRRSVRFLILDEVDGYQDTSDGDPISLAAARTSKFWNRKIVLCSTPTVEGRSKISKAFEASDQRLYFAPCPFCNHMQVLEWPGVRWGQVDVGGDGKPLADGRFIAPEDAHYQCAECRGFIPHHRKWEMLRAGEWRATNPDGKYPGFRISRLYSPDWSWGKIVTDPAEGWLATHESPAAHQTFRNNILAETWREPGDAPPNYEVLMSRHEDYRLGQVPDGVLFLTAGVDVQKTWLEGYVWGWGRRKQSWVIDHIRIDKNPYDPTAWDDLTERLNQSYQRKSGAALSIVRMGVDTRYEGNQVYAWARQHGSSRVLAVAGMASGPPVGSPTQVDLTVGGRKIKHGCKLWGVNVSHWKSELYGQLNLPRPKEGEEYPVGWVHFPTDLPDEFYRQLTSEEFRLSVRRGGVRSYHWEPIENRRHEALDCRDYSRAVASVFGMDRHANDERWWAALEVTGGVVTKPAAPQIAAVRAPAPEVVATSIPVPIAAPWQEREKSNWLGGRGGRGWLGR